MIERALVEAAASLRRRGEPHLLATVVGVRGSAYRRPGARMLLARDRWVAGSISGGCLERDLVRKAWFYAERGPAVVTYDASAQEADARGEGARVAAAFGLGCGGAVDVLLEEVLDGRIDPLRMMGESVASQRRCALATVVGGTGAPLGARLAVTEAGEVSDGALPTTVRAAAAVAARHRLRGEGAHGAAQHDAHGARVLVEVLAPPPRLFVFGSGHDAVPVARLARAVGWEVVVCAHGGDALTAARFGHGGDERLADRVTRSLDESAALVSQTDRALAVVMGHHVDRDREALRVALASRALYVGALGPRRRTDALLAELGVCGDDPRLHAPVGLSIGAETPAEIALSIVAEAQAVMAAATGASLRGRGAIHASPEGVS